jgi:hypothetical protein
VVVDGDFAYITLRGGNSCGATESGLFLVDISDISNPSLTATYPMEEPYGLGIMDNKLFVCDGSYGLKVYDTTNVPELLALQQFEDITTFDVIPLQDHLLMVGEGTLYQYRYSNMGLELISSMSLH